MGLKRGRKFQVSLFSIYAEHAYFLTEWASPFWPFPICKIVKLSISAWLPVAFGIGLTLGCSAVNVVYADQNLGYIVSEDDIRLGDDALKKDHRLGGPYHYRRMPSYQPAPYADKGVPSPVSQPISVSKAPSMHPHAEDDPVMIYGNSWGLTLALDGSGFYNDFLKTIMSGMEHPPTYQPAPYSRAKSTFLASKNGCLYPSTRSVLKDGEEIENIDDFIETTPFLRVRVFILAAKGRPVYTPGVDLKDQIIVHARGSRIATVMKDSGATFLAANGELDKARLLVSGRVDYIMASLPDTAFVFQSMGEPLPRFDPTSEFFGGGVGVVCHKTPENKVLIDQLNDAYMHQLKAGALSKLFENTGLDAGDYLPEIE
jgi:hypothetical protein